MKRQNLTPNKKNNPVDMRHVTFQALLKGIPYIGEALNHLIYSRLDEIRWSRVESTLKEISEKLEEKSIPPNFNDRFVNFLEELLPVISKETIEEKRKSYVEYLINTSTIQSDDEEEEAKIVLNILKEISYPGLAILAGAKIGSEKGQVAFVSYPKPQVFFGKFDESNLDKNELCYELKFNWPIVEEWTRRLRERRLIIYGSHGKYGYYGGGITELGKIVVNWCYKS